MKRLRGDHASVLEKAAKARAKESFVLCLYVAGITPRSDQAIRALKEICEQHLKGRYDLEIVDIYQQPESVKRDQVVVAPTLVKKLPLPLRRLIGDMTDREKILVGLDLKSKDE